MSRTKRPGLLKSLLRLAGAAALGAAIDNVHAVDERARSRIASSRRPLLDEWMPILTDLGSMYALAGTSLALWLGGQKKLARDVAGAGTLAWIVAQSAKKGFNRTRPYHAGNVEMLVREPAGTSYPSGHPAVAAAIAAVVEPEVPRITHRALHGMPRLVAFSRIYCGVHYPSDVFGGILVGKAVGDLWHRYAR